MSLKVAVFNMPGIVPTVRDTEIVVVGNSMGGRE